MVAKTLNDPVVIGRNGKMIVVAQRSDYEAALRDERGISDDALVQYWNSALGSWSAPQKIGIMARFIFFEPATGELKDYGLSYP